MQNIKLSLLAGLVDRYLAELATARRYFGFITAVCAVAILMLLAPVTGWPVGGFLSAPALAAQPESFSIGTPLELNKTPRIILQRGVVVFGGARKSELARPSGLNSRSARRIQLKGGFFTIDTGRIDSGPNDTGPNDTGKSRSALAVGKNKTSDGQPENIIGPMLGALTNLGFTDLEVLKTSLIIRNGSGGSIRRISSISVRVTKNNANIFNAKGSFKYRGRKVAFTAMLNGNRKLGSNGMVPFEVKMNEAGIKLLAGGFNGMLGVSSGLQLEGKVELSSPDLRQAAAWLMGKFPAGPGLKNFKAVGAASFINDTLSFKKSSFEIDGNKSTGGLSFNFKNKRPSIAATLAATSLNLNPYFKNIDKQSGGISADPNNNSNKKLKTAVDYDLTLPVIRYFDADVRLSAEQVRLGSLQIGKAAIAVSLSDGKLHADIVKVIFAGGSGVGQISADMSGLIPNYAIRGKFESTDISELSKIVLGNKFITGGAVLTVGVDGSALTFRKLLKKLSGKIRVVLPNGGYIGIDPKAMVEAAKLKDLKGWTPMRGQVRVNGGHAVFQVRNGVLNAVRLNAIAGDFLIACKGRINLANKYLNMKIRVSKVNSALASIASRAAILKSNSLRNFDTIRLRGNWHEPIAHLELHPQQPLKSGSVGQPDQG